MAGAIPCFLVGTHILTAKGEVPVEQLQPGDLVVTASGESKPVRWVGHKTLKKQPGAAWQDDAMPVHIRPNALADMAPHGDLYVSPLHAFLIDGVLIRAKTLVNGISILREAPDARCELTYVHVALETHDVILAEGAPAETLHITADRQHEMFANFADYERQFGREVGTMKAYAPLVDYWSRRDRVQALARRALSVFVDVRDPIMVAKDRLKDRATF